MMYYDIVLKVIRNIIIAILLVICIIATYIYRNEIITFMSDFINPKPPIVIKGANKYKYNWDYEYVQNTKDFEPSNYQDLLNIFYTVVNSGWDNFTFYCPDDYKGCIDDVQKMANNQSTLSIINNYVHPFNSYKSLQTVIVGNDRIDVTVNHLYNDANIIFLEELVDEIDNKLLKDNMSAVEKIRVVHDFIINNAEYDQNMIGDNGSTPYQSNTAFGPLVEGYAICGGYSDAMQLFLFNLGIKNFKVSSDRHIWNLVYINDAWLHLDLTWDDPIMSDGSDRLKHTYFLIPTSTLEKLNTDNSHTYNKTIFKEAK